MRSITVNFHQNFRQRAGNALTKRFTNKRKTAAEGDNLRMKQMRDVREGKGKVTGESVENGLCDGVVLREGGSKVFGFASLFVSY